jgi:hypothetical protein
VEDIREKVRGGGIGKGEEAQGKGKGQQGKRRDSERGMKRKGRR